MAQCECRYCKLSRILQGLFPKCTKEEHEALDEIWSRMEAAETDRDWEAHKAKEAKAKHEQIHNMSWKITSELNTDGCLKMTLSQKGLDGIQEVIMREVLNLKEEQVRDGLIKFGWTPPGETVAGQKCQECNWTNTNLQNLGEPGNPRMPLPKEPVLDGDKV